MHTDLISAQSSGGHTQATAKMDMRSRHTALNLYKEACERLMDVNNWTHVCGDTGTEFKLTDEEGNPVQKTTTRVGNLIRIKAPALPNKTGDGIDWLRIEAFEQSKNLIKDEELFGFRVRLVQNPANKTAESGPVYLSDTNSTFLVLRNSSMVYVMERERSETVSESGSLLNNLKNRLAVISERIGLSKPQWKLLVNGILKPVAK